MSLNAAPTALTAFEAVAADFLRDDRPEAADLAALLTAAGI
nr:hypothetical protein [Actinomyces sp.]